jgi:TonB family protein
MASRIELVPSICLFLSLAINLPVKADAGEASQLLQRAADLSDLRAPGSQPFELTADIEIPSPHGQPFKGTYRLLWLSESKWREEITLPGYTRVRVGGAGKYWQKRSSDFEVLAIYELSEVLDFVSHLRSRARQLTPKVRRERDHGQQLQCVVHEIDREHPPDRREEFCLDASQGTIAVEKWPGRFPDASAGPTAALFSDYVKVEDKLIPKRIAVMADPDPMVVLSVDKVSSPGQINELDFIPPQGSQPWGTCANPQLPALVHQPLPHYPEAVKQNHIMGSVRVYGVIGTDGSLSNLKVLSAPDSSLAAASMTAVQQWKYRPQACDGNPVPHEIIIEIIFTLGG